MEIHLGHEVVALDQLENGSWKIEINDVQNKQEKIIATNFVFIGTGGDALKLLEKSNIPAGDGYGGFLVVVNF